MKFNLVRNSSEGIRLAKSLLYRICDKNTVLFLSGGSTPAPLYKSLASEQRLKVGALAMVDDRYSLHEQYSNEFMIRESGIITFLDKGNVPFYSILRYGMNLSQTAREYEKDVEFLFGKFKKRVAILGVGSDGHIASISPVHYDDTYHHSDRLVIDVKDFPGEIKERITLTFDAISKMNLLIVLVFGKDKKEGIRIALKTFFKGDLSKKTISERITILITDQPVSPVARRGGKV